jgi:NAD(P)H-dependent FMN reductase
MRIGIISGSHRDPSQSAKVADFMQQQLARSGIETWVYTLANNPLPLWDQKVWEKDEGWNSILTPLKKDLSECDGFIIVTPEWHGQVPAGLKNFFLLFGRFELGHKPALITAVSSGDGGAYPVAELRMSSYKNNRICYIPEQLILRNVETILNANPTDNNDEADTYFRERIDWALEILKGYSIALKNMRDTTDIFHDKFGNGM